MSTGRDREAILTGDVSRGSGAARPRVVVVGFEQAVADELAPLCGRLGRFPDEESFRAAAAIEETDVVVAERLSSASDAHLVLWGDQIVLGPEGSERVRAAGRREDDLQLPADPPAELAEAIGVLAARLYSDGSALPLVDIDDGADPSPLLTTRTGEVVAALYRVVDDDPPRIGLAIPTAAPLALWFRSFLHHLHRVDPEAVPMPPPRLSHPLEWDTPAELRLTGRLSELEEEAAVLARRIEATREELRQSTEAADVCERLALWAEGDDLVGAVRMLLEEIGFGVTEEEVELVDGAPAREDLHVHPPEDAVWTAMVEVRSYEGDALPTDLRTINQHRMAYIAREGGQPDRVWWVVNHHRETDPSYRPPLLEGYREQPTLFDVVAVSTADLYLLWRDVKLDRVEPAMARKMLAEAEPGVFSRTPRT